MKSSIKKILAISTATRRELLRSKIPIAMMTLAAISLSIAALFGSVAIGNQAVILKDFGLFALSFFSVLYCILSGATLLHKELEKKTIYTTLSRPVTRWEYLTGKYWGIYHTCLLFLIGMTSCFVMLLRIVDDSFSPTFLQGYYHIALELCIISAIVIFFSSLVVTPILVGLFSFGVFLTGRSLEALLSLIDSHFITGIGAYLLKGIYWMLPHLYLLNINDSLVNTTSISIRFTAWCTVYTIAYSGIALLLAQRIFQKREFH